MLMLQFLNSDLDDLSLKLLAFIIKSEILENYNTSIELTKIDFYDSKMSLRKKDLYLRFIAEEELRHLRLKNSE